MEITRAEGLTNGTSKQCSNYTSAPGTPTDVEAMLGYGSATVAFAEPASNGGFLNMWYVATASPGGASSTCTKTPCFLVANFTDGVSYTFTVVAVNSLGRGVPSAPSNPVIPGERLSGACPLNICAD